MTMTLHLLIGLLAAGTYYAPQGQESVAVVARGKTTPCYRLAPAAKVTVEGPAKVIKLVVPSGSHEIAIEFPAERTGCVAFTGVTLVTPPQPPEPEPAPVAESESPTDAPVSSVATPAAAEALVTPPAPPVVAPARGPATAPSSNGDVEVITAQSGEAAGAAKVEEPSPPPESAGPALLRLGVKGGGVLPRGDLAPTFYVGGLVELSLTAVGIPVGFTLGDARTDLTMYVEGGWSPFTQQDQVMIQGRGRTQLIQSSLVLPFEVGARFLVDLGFAGLQPFVAVGLAMDVTRTELRAFSLPPEQENDFALGFAVALGTWLSLGPGAILVELRYREIQSDMGSFAQIAENVFANFALHVGYAFAIGG